MDNYPVERLAHQITWTFKCLWCERTEDVVHRDEEQVRRELPEGWRVASGYSLSVMCSGDCEAERERALEAAWGEHPGGGTDLGGIYEARGEIVERERQRAIRFRALEADRWGFKRPQT